MTGDPSCRQTKGSGGHVSAKTAALSSEALNTQTSEIVSILPVRSTNQALFELFPIKNHGNYPKSLRSNHCHSSQRVPPALNQKDMSARGASVRSDCTNTSSSTGPRADSGRSPLRSGIHALTPTAPPHSLH